MGESIEEGTISAILKQEGDSVKMDEAIFQIETDKVTVDVRAPEAGTLDKIMVSWRKAACNAWGIPCLAQCMYNSLTSSSGQGRGNCQSRAGAS